MESSELVSLIKGLYEAGIHATVSIDSNNNVEVDFAPRSSDFTDRRPPYIFPDTVGDPDINWLINPDGTRVETEEVLHPATKTVCLDPDKMTGAGDDFGGSD